MGKPSDSDRDDDALLRLIADVHPGPPAQQDRLDKALGTLESTHRQASAAMQRFERTGRTTPGQKPAAAVALSWSTNVAEEPAGSAAPPKADAAHRRLDASTAEVTHAGPIPHAPPAAPRSPPQPAPLPLPEERTQTAIAKPAKPIAVAEVLSGRGAEFAPRGATQTHIIRPQKNIPKK